MYTCVDDGTYTCGFIQKIFRILNYFTCVNVQQSWNADHVYVYTCVEDGTYAWWIYSKIIQNFKLYLLATSAGNRAVFDAYEIY